MYRIRSLASVGFAFSCLLSLVALPVSEAHAQAGLRESLERLDKDEDGRIGPDEITPLARPYLERIAKARRLSLYRENDISDFQEAARIYYALQNGVASDRTRATPDESLRSFRPDDDDYLVPEFGLAEVKYRYTQDDVDEAENTLNRYDRDDNGFLSRREVLRARWTHLDPFESDVNKDNQLSKMELIQRYARRRLLDDASDELVQRARRVGNGIEPSRKRPEGREDRSSWWRRGGSSSWLAASLLGRFDANRNGRLEAGESAELGMPVGIIDIDRNGELTREELLAYLQPMQEEFGEPGDGLPGWFYELDQNRDTQISMPEFAAEWSDGRVEEFDRLDLNQDGLLTESEVLQAKSVMGGSFSNDTATILPPRKTIISEIEVTEDLEIRELSLQLSITHTSVGYLDGYLTGPDGQRIELFTEVGGSGDHFQKTTFSDKASAPINKARPPFEGKFLPEGLVKRQPGLGHWTGKNAKGVWQLVIRGTRSERFGMLHDWKLMFQAQEDSIGERFAAMQAEKEANDGQSQTQSRPSSPAQNAAYSANSDSKRARGEQATQAWVNAGGSEQVKRRQEALERYRAWEAKMKAEGREITGEGKKQFFGEFSSDRGKERGEKRSRDEKAEWKAKQRYEKGKSPK
ncbi:MAG: proprotein convertase P-domain-containing protein [Aureliella sp.]